jgi:hypothetical protein
MDDHVSEPAFLYVVLMERRGPGETKALVASADEKIVAEVRRLLADQLRASAS